MKPHFFIGIDISKLTLDVAVISGGATIAQLKIDNTEAAIKELLKTLKSDYGCTRFNSFYCAESMGIYSTFLLNVCIKKKLVICQESALQIKKSLGIQRGKNDALDSARIASYAAKNYLSLKVWEPPRQVVEQLKYLSSLRRRLIKTKLLLMGNRKNETYYLTKSQLKNTDKYTEVSLQAITDSIEKVEKEMEESIKADERLNHLMKLIISVPGIGKVIATELIIYTNEFNSSWTAKRFASYCGVAPFEWTSGTSVKGKARVSFFANKSIKSLLSMGALTLIRTKNNFMSLYYHRKVLEGKNKMSILNAVRNKLLHRVFACVRENKPFVELEIN